MKTSQTHRRVVTVVKRREHAALCPECGSVNVIIDTTRTRVILDTPENRAFLRRQHCRCLDCLRRFARRVNVTERISVG